jgi:hypothetical protein
MPITCIYGLPGKGKSQFSLFYAILLANKYKKSIVANFSINHDALISYCQKMGYQDLLDRLAWGESSIYYCDMEQDNILDSILSIPNSINIIDEAGAYIRARGSTTSTPKKFLKDLTQVRHQKQYALFISQSDKQIDSAIKVLADEIIHCSGISIYDSKIDAPRLQLKTVRRFTPDKYEIFASNPRIQGNPLKAYLSANKNWVGFPTAADNYLFSIYDSFGLIHDDKIGKDGRGRKHLGAASVPASPSFYCYPIPQSCKVDSKIETFLFKFLPAEYTPLVNNSKRVWNKYFVHHRNYNEHRLCLVLAVPLLLLLLPGLLRVIF